jgi:hypothetical protein
MVDVSEDFWFFVETALTNGEFDELYTTTFYIKVKTAMEHDEKLAVSYRFVIEEYPPEVIASMSPPPVGVFFARHCIIFDNVDSLFKGMRDILLYWRDPRGDAVHECLELLLNTIELQSSLENLEL